MTAPRLPVGLEWRRYWRGDLAVIFAGRPGACLLLLEGQDVDARAKIVAGILEAFTSHCGLSWGPGVQPDTAHEDALAACERRSRAVLRPWGSSC